MNDYLARSREHWKRAQAYPLDKTSPDVYPAHGIANDYKLVTPGMRVLEYGCGGGADAISYARLGAIVSVVDIVPGNVQMTLARLDSAGLGGQVASWAELDESAKTPFASDHFDLVSCIGVLHHIIDPGPVLAEFRRVLRPGGRLTLMVYTELLEARLEALIAGFMGATGATRAEAFGSFTDGNGTPHTRSYTVEQGRELLARAGFELVSTAEYNDRDFRTFRGRRP